ncbi:hypothetical protein GCM10023159_25080 [Brevibacterium yomogidense]
MPKPQTPDNLEGAGLDLWKSITDEFHLAPPELALLEETCRVRTRISELDSIVATDGLMTESAQGPRVHPALVETRQQRLLYAKLAAQLRIPMDDL